MVRELNVARGDHNFSALNLLGDARLVIQVGGAPNAEFSIPTDGLGGIKLSFFYVQLFRALHQELPILSVPISEIRRQR